MGAPPLIRAATSRLPRYSPGLQSALERLEKLINWERRMRVDQDAANTPLMRVSNAPASKLLHRLSNPHKSLKAVHITGTKGKGSVATLLSAALTRTPLTPGPIGTYGSPHVERINERIRFDGVEIEDDLLASAYTRVLDARDVEPVLTDATWFDVMCTASFVAFHDANVSWAVVEVGIGGRLDSTNVIDAPVAVMTNISLEHADIIGPTLRDITYEKAGIIAPAAHVICGLKENDQLADIVRQEAQSKSPPATIQFCPPQTGSSIFDHNLSLAREALRAVLRYEKQEADVDSLLSHAVAKAALAKLPGRQESFSVRTESDPSQTVDVLLDGAHVPKSVTQVLQEMEMKHPPIVVLAISREKDASGICKAIKQASPQHVFTTAVSANFQYLSSTELAAFASGVGLLEVTAIDDPYAALENAIVAAHASERRTPVVVIGSLHLAGVLRSYLRQLNIT